MAQLRNFVGRFSFHVATGSILLALIALAVPLRLSSLREVSDGQLERTQERLIDATRRFTQDFDREITRAVIYFAIHPASDKDKIPHQLLKRLEHWRSHSPHPRLVRALYLQHGRRLERAPLMELGSSSSTSEQHSIEWPSRFDPIVEPAEHHLDASDQAGATFQDEIPALVLPLLCCEPEAPSSQPPAGAYSTADGHIIIELDLGYVAQEFIPRLAERHLAIGDGVAYQLAVVRRTDPPTTIYQSDDSFSIDEFSTPDVSGYVFDLLFEEQYRELLLNVGLSLGMLIPESEQAQAEFAAAQVPASVLSEGQSDFGRWQVLVGHPAGSLQRAFDQQNRRRVALSLGLFALLGATAMVLVVSTQRAQKLANQQLDFVAGVSHELRTPLSVIRMASRNLERGTVRSEASVKQYAELIGAEERRLTGMVEQVLAFGQMQQGEKAFAGEPVPIGDVVELALADCEPLLVESAADIARQIPQESLVVRGDPEALRKAVQNLVANAIKHSGKDPRVRVGVERRNREVAITVSDQGEEISSEDLPHIFEPFYRGKLAVSNQIQGSGLGLALVREIIEAHRGRVSVASDTGGSAFTLSLPLVDEASGAAG